MEVLELLTEGKAVLERDGWCQHTFHNREGQHCAVGALKEARQLRGQEPLHGDVYWQARDILRKAITARERHYVVSVTEWNDVIGRTADEVLAVFDEAIARASGTHT